MHQKERSARVSVYAAAVLALVLGGLAPKAASADITVEPSVSLGEEYNDNVHLQNNQDKADAFITRFAPSAHVKYNTSLWDWDINYTYTYYYYYFLNKYNNAGGKEANHDQTHTLNARNHTVILQDSLFLDVSDEYSRVSQNVAIDYSQQSPSANQVDQNIFTVNPVYRFRPSAATRSVVGYLYRETRYRNSADNTQTLIDRRDDDTVYTETAVDLSSRLTATAGVQYMQETNDQGGFRRVSYYAGPQYTYAENCFLYARLGKDRFTLQNNSDAGREYWAWDAGISHRMNTTALVLAAHRLLAEDPQRSIILDDQYTATVTKTGTRSEQSLQGGWHEYRDAVLDQRISTSKQVQGHFLYRVTPTTTGTLEAGFQHVDDLALNGVIRIVTANLRFDHQLSVRDTAGFAYRYAKSQSNELPSYNYSNNRYIVEYRHVF